MTVTVLFFAQARERAGCARAVLELAERATVADLHGMIRRDYPRVAELLPTLAIAIDGELARPATPIRPGAEVALLPPVSGG
jgi:molybdopterin synthase catalytic subunit